MGFIQLNSLAQISGLFNLIQSMTALEFKVIRIWACAPLHVNFNTSLLGKSGSGFLTNFFSFLPFPAAFIVETRISSQLVF
jgi:hypothetical protein